MEKPQKLYIAQDIIMKSIFINSKLNSASSFFQDYHSLLEKHEKSVDGDNLRVQQELMMNHIDELATNINTIIIYLSRVSKIQVCELNDREKKLMNLDFNEFSNTIIDKYFIFLYPDTQSFPSKFNDILCKLVIYPITINNTMSIIFRFQVLTFYLKNREVFEFFAPGFPASKDLLKLTFFELISNTEILNQMENIIVEKSNVKIDKDEFNINSLEAEDNPAGRATYSIFYTNLEKILLKFQEKMGGNTADGFVINLELDSIANTSQSTFEFDFEDCSSQSALPLGQKVGEEEEEYEEEEECEEEEEGEEEEENQPKETTAPSNFYSHNLYVKQFFINTKSFRNMNKCLSPISIRDLYDAKKHTIKRNLRFISQPNSNVGPQKKYDPVHGGKNTSLPFLQKPSNYQQLKVEKDKKQDKNIYTPPPLILTPLPQSVTNGIPKREEYVPIKFNGYANSSCTSNSSMGTDAEEQLCQMNIATEFFGYYLLNYLKKAPEFTVVSSRVLNQPLIVMHQIPPGYEFISEFMKKKELNNNLNNRGVLFKMAQNIQLLRTIHFLFVIGDFNESNVAINEGEISIVDLWTCMYIPEINDILTITDDEFHSYQVEVLEKVKHYLISSIINNESKRIEGTVDNTHVTILLSWLTIKALEIFQNNEIGFIEFSERNIENYPNWMKNNSLLNCLLFKDLFLRSQIKIYLLGLTNYFQNAEFAQYKEDAQKRFPALFKSLSTNIISKLTSPDCKDSDHLQILIELNKNIFSYTNNHKGEIFNFDVFKEIQNIRLNSNRTQNIVVLTFTLKKPSIPSSIKKDGRWNIFVNSLVLYDLLFEFFSEQGKIMNDDSILSFCSRPSTVFQYPKG